MNSITAEEFREWKSHPVTEEVMKVLRDMTNDLAKKLVDEAGLNSLNDRYNAGLIAGYTDVLKLDLIEE